MQDPFLLDVTASEPLTIEQEVKMQQEWRDDERKCTFIILARDILSTDYDVSIDIPSKPMSEGCAEENTYPNLVEESLHSMIGDINLFLSEEEEEIDGDIWNQQSTKNDGDETETKELSQAELDIMIARESHRHKGLGVELALTMMRYGASALGIRRFFVKVKETNNSSIRLFRDKLGFVQCAYAECFGEYEFEFKQENAADMVQWIDDNWKKYCAEKGQTDFCKLYDIHNCPLPD